jgi:hypothetical protein
MDGLRHALNLSLGRALPPTTDPSEARALDQVVRRLGTDGLLRRLDRCLEADTQIDRRVQLVLVLEALVDALA